MATSGTISFGGLFSGLDTKDIITQLVSLREKRSLEPITERKIEIQTQKLGLETVEGTFNELLKSSKSLDDPSNVVWNAKTTSSSDTDKIIIQSTSSSLATSGKYDITEVTALAQPDKVIFSGEADKDTTQFGTGTFTITYNSNATQVVISSSNNTLEGIVTAINDANSGVSASIINDGATNPYRLVLTSGDSGADYSITHNIDTILTGLAVDAAASSDPDNEAQDAAFKINSVSITSSSNNISEAIPGVNFTLLETFTTGTVSLNVKQDTASIVTNISDYIDKYNALKINVSALTTTDEDGKFGPLGRDFTLTSANIRIHSIMGSTFNSLAGYPYTNLAQIGVVSGTTAGLAVDTAKLITALENNPENVRLLFQGTSTEDGIAEKMKDYIDALVNPLGIFAEKAKNNNQTIAILDKEIESRKSLIEIYSERLNEQFNNLEIQLNKLRSQEAQITQFIGSRNSSSNMLF